MTAWYFCSIFHFEGSQSAFQAGENKEIMFLLMKCSRLQVRMQQVFDTRKVHPCFEKKSCLLLSDLLEALKVGRALADQSSMVFFPHTSLPAPGTPLLSLPAAQGFYLLSVPNHNLMRSSRNQTSSKFPLKKLKLSSFRPFLCILKLSHSPSCFPWYRLYTEPEEHCFFPPFMFIFSLVLFLVCFMLAYAGKCLGKLTGKVLQNAVCIVFLFPV